MEGYKLSKEYVPGLVSIVIPTHNRADIVGETIDSVFAQSYPLIELIVVDDHSSDTTASVVAKKQKESPLYGFQYIKSDGRGGQYARNKGIILSKGEYIQFFDDDDLMLSSHIAKKVEVLNDNKKKIDFVTCNFNYFEGAPDHIVDEKRVDDIIHTVDGHLLTSSFPAPVFMCRRICIDEIGFWNESIQRFQDISYFHRLFLQGKRGEFLPDKLFLVRKHAKSISTNNSVQFYQAMYNAYETVKQEWREAGRESKMLRRVLLLLQVNICLQAIMCGHKWWGLKHIVVLCGIHLCTTFWLLYFSYQKQVHRWCGQSFSSYRYIFGEKVER